MNSLPQHVAIIMDGNGRWARAQNKPRIFGHKAGAETARSIIKHARRIDIKTLSLFTFSSENWSRPRAEVSFIMDLLKKMLLSEVQELHRNDIRVTFTGDLQALSPKLQQLIEDAKCLTADNRAMTLNLVLNYGGRWDILQAAKALAKDYQQGNINLDDIDEAAFANYFTMAEIREPDLFIRTSGECRISNFFLWQLAYTELVFCESYWPEFTTERFDEAIQVFTQRERRYGALKQEEDIC